MVALFSWFSTGSIGSSGSGSSSGVGDWGSFTPNLGGFSSTGGGDGGFGGFGSYGVGGSGRFGSGGWGGGFAGGSSMALDHGNGGDFGAFEPVDDGFTNSDPLGGYPIMDYGSVTNLGTVTVTAQKPNLNSYNPNTVLFDQIYNPVEVPYDPTVPDLGTRVIAVKPDIPDEGLTEAQWRDWWAEEQVKVFAPFTGGLASFYDGIKSWLAGDWWGLGLAAAGVLPVGKFGGLGYSSFSAFKRGEGLAGYSDDGVKQAWHHIVEKRMESRFGAHQIHNVDNLMKVDVPTHNKISGFYKAIDPETGIPRRDMLDQMPYDEQYEFGMGVLRDHGVVK